MVTVRASSPRPALLLDRMKDVTPMLNWTARETYDAEIHSFVVPEGAQVDPPAATSSAPATRATACRKQRSVKIFRSLIGVDDIQPQRLRILPALALRLVSEIAISKYFPLSWSKMKTERPLCCATTCAARA